MIHALRGKVFKKNPETLEVDVSGVIFQVKITLNAYSILPPVGNECFIPVEMVFGERDIELYGFADENEREMFRCICGVRGIGPRIARNILSSLSLDQFVSSVKRGEVRTLSKIPGVGKKTAERLIFELKDRVAAAEKEEAEPVVFQAVEALVNLGFKRTEAEDTVAQLAGSCSSVEELIRASLRRLARI